ncbi:hypothetical protein LINGRAHAP2_LOCUS8075 [Linum grandiflorum]
MHHLMEELEIPALYSQHYQPPLQIKKPNMHPVSHNCSRTNPRLWGKQMH